VQLKQALSAAIERLTLAQVPSPRMNAELLIKFTLDCDRAYLYAHPERELTADETHRYDAAIDRRATGVPAQYITGHQEFWGLDLIVTPAVLIPRPETEHVIETVLELTKLSDTDKSQERRTGVSAPHGQRKIRGGSGSEIHVPQILPAEDRPGQIDVLGCNGQPSRNPERSFIRH